MAVISLLLASTTTCPSVIRLALAGHRPKVGRLTMWMADLPLVADQRCASVPELRRNVLPSTATSWPSVISCSAVIQRKRHFLELGRFDRRQYGVEAMVRRDAGDQVQELRQPLLLRPRPQYDRYEIIRAGHHRAHRAHQDGDDVDQW